MTGWPWLGFRTLDDYIEVSIRLVLISKMLRGELREKPK